MILIFTIVTVMLTCRCPRGFMERNQNPGSWELMDTRSIRPGPNQHARWQCIWLEYLRVVVRNLTNSITVYMQTPKHIREETQLNESRPNSQYIEPYQGREYIISLHVGDALTRAEKRQVKIYRPIIKPPADTGKTLFFS